MRSNSRRVWPLFVVVAILALVGLVVLHGTAAAVELVVTFAAFIAVCIYKLAGEKVNDGVGGIGGPFA